MASSSNTCEQHTACWLFLHIIQVLELSFLLEAPTPHSLQQCKNAHEQLIQVFSAHHKVHISNKNRFKNSLTTASWSIHRFNFHKKNLPGLIYFSLGSRIMTICFSLTSTEGLPSSRLLDSVLTHQNYSSPKDNIVPWCSHLNKPTCIGFKISLSLTVLHHLEVR